MSVEDRHLGLLVVFILCSFFSHAPFQGCNRYTSFGYGYRDFFEFRAGNFSPNEVFYLEFYVKTSSDAHILLKSEVTEDNGYEIVIGGGSNTFSQIRLLDPKEKKTMITQITENFLSANEYRNFWISIDKLGIISVGKKEDDEVFINWRFDNPIPVKWFSFGSWTNMKADWRFGCEKQRDSGVVHEEAEMSPLRKLKRDLFTLYDPNALPVERNATLEVKVSFQISTVQLDEKRGELTLTGSGNLEWQDPKMRWKPEDYNGIQTVYVPPFQIWTPNIRVLNALVVDKTPLFDLTTAGVMVKFDGSINWRAPFKSLSHCAVDLKYWPYDAHNCSILVGFWMEPPNLVLTLIEDSETDPKIRSQLSKERFDSSWEIIRVHPFNTNPSGEEENYGILDVEIKRRSGPQTLVLTAPYVATLLMCLASFWVPLDSSLKLEMSCGSLLILLCTLFFAGTLVPAMTKTVPRILLLYSWSTVISCIPLVSYVILKCMEIYISISQTVSKMLSSGNVSKIFCLSDLSTIQTDYSNLKDEVDSAHKDRFFVFRLMTVLERIFFLIYIIALLVPMFLI